MRRAIRALPAAWVLCASQALGQSTPTDVPAQAAASMPAPAAGEAEKSWAFSASLYGYILPESPDYLLPTVTADRGWLHLEARYNYEDLDTGSAWVGYNLGGGDVLEWELTPLLGGVFGGTDGVAFGYKGSLSWWKLELYSEGEYVIEVGNTSDSFFYNWSELTLAPLEWFRFGLVTQRTRAYDAERDIQRGLLFGLSWEPLDLTACVFNIDDCEPMVVVGLGVSF